jgi:DNA modification methylase
MQIIQGHSLSILKTLDSASIDCIVTSPPYWQLRDYHNSDIDFGDWQGQLGLEPSLYLYINHICNIFDECYRVLKKEGTCWVNIGDTYATQGGQNLGKRYDHPSTKIDNVEMGTTLIKSKELPHKCLCQIPNRFAIEMCRRGWILRNEIIWHKPNAMPCSSTDRFTVDFEKLFFFTKSEKYYFEQQFDEYDKPMNRWGGDKLIAKNKSSWDEGTEQTTYRDRNMRPNEKGRNKRTTWSINTQSYTDAHFATFPKELVTTPIKSGCPISGIVLDLFAGSGTVAEVCLELERDFIMIELNPEYIKLIEQRIENFKNRFALFE